MLPRREPQLLVLSRRSALLVLCLLVVSCGAAPPSVSSVTLPAGWQTVDESGISFALPPTWEVLAPEDGNFESGLDDLVRENPGLQATAEQTRKLVSGGQVKALAFDLAPEDLLASFTTNLTVGVQPMNRSASIETVATANEAALQANGFTGIRREVRAIGGQQMARLVSSIQIVDAAGGALPLAFEQYIVVDEQSQYVLTFSTAADQHPRMQPTFEQIAATLRIE